MVAVAGGRQGARAALSFTGIEMADFNSIIEPTHTLSATYYVGGNGEMHIVKPMRDFENAVAPQNIPSGTIENHAARTPGTGRSRSAGVAMVRVSEIFEDPPRYQIVAVTEDMTGGDPGAVFGFPSPGKSAIVITIMDQQGNIVVPSFMYPHGGRNSAARQSVAGTSAPGSRWFIVRTAENTATVFHSDGTVLADVGDYIAGAPLPSGIVSIATGGTDCAVAAASYPWYVEGPDRAFVATSGKDELGYEHPCIVCIDIDPASNTAAVTQVIQADDDLPADSGFVGLTAMDIDATGYNDYRPLSTYYLMAVWKQGSNQSPVARYFDRDGKPMCPSFWVSSKEDEDTNTGDPTIKCCAGTFFSGVAWLSESFEPGNNCVGNPMERDTVVRFFEPPWTVLDVDDWQTY